MVQILKGIHHLHTRSIAHRDLKPENLLLSNKTKDAIIKIADFGFARRLIPPNELMNVCCGSPSYLAPELLRLRSNPKAPGAGIAVDMWALGVILYILLCGYPPFGGSDEEMYKQILQGSFDFDEIEWRLISEEAKDLIRCLLNSDPSKRYTVQQALDHPWLRSAATYKTPLVGAQAELKKFQARKKFKGAIHAVTAVNKMRRLSFELGRRRSQENLLKVCDSSEFSKAYDSTECNKACDSSECNKACDSIECSKA